jgi:hypothetical protein
MSINKTAPDGKNPSLFLRDVSGNRLWQWNGIFRIEVIKNNEVVSYSTEFTPEKLTLKVSDKETVELTYQHADVLRVKAKNISLRLTQTIKDANSYYIPLDATSIRAQMGGYAHYFIKTLEGKMTVDGIQTLERGDRDKLHLIIDFIPNQNGVMEMAIHQYRTGLEITNYSQPFETCISQNRNSFEKYLNNTKFVDKQFESKRYDAAYINWSSVISKKGFMTRDAMLMSKVNMRSVWSWDNCFNALASVRDKKSAFNNFILPFDYQDKTTGALPDAMNNHNVTWGFVKPPIHGWALDKLMAKGMALSSSEMEECYLGLEKWTSFWFLYMDDDKNGIPQYNHGNDSGWDNATYFDKGYSVESADLCAFLALQMECLSNLARKMGKEKESIEWKNKSEKLIKDMITYFWDGTKFVSKRTIDKGNMKESKSLLRFMPLVLGNRLPENIRKTMLSDLTSKEGNLTEFGLASESPSSILYEADGYWRGPIWAPTTYLLVDALTQIGEKSLAKEIAYKYCKMCEKSGFAENFDATTGAPLRDSGYTWTSSVFLLLLEEY